ncbi:LrgB family protein [Bauldia litoralis]|uniref:TIGR00659 family protein n=2 Tax=Bauldia litoralis TaxID=665467 RepID=A0A1G6B7A8_9HYPH|nr:LrgB family protein [Bauldia litoralis]SDB16544.1 TIGR00659 family protein [Bauldia litoralis]
MNPAIDLWVYLSTSPLAWLALTLAAYVVADRIARRLNRHPLANPVVIAVVLVIIALQVSETPFETYFEGAQFVHFLLGPATVALAIPLVENWRRVKRSALPILIALVAGSVTAVGSAVGIGALLGASPPILASLAGKSVTTPIAMGIAEQLGGIPTLTAVLVIFTGVLGAVMVTPVMNVLRIRDYAARGFAAGVAAHGIGTARAFQVNELAGTFAGLAMGLNGILTALLVPILAHFLAG